MLRSERRVILRQGPVDGQISSPPADCAVCTVILPAGRRTAEGEFLNRSVAARYVSAGYDEGELEVFRFEGYDDIGPPRQISE